MGEKGLGNQFVQDMHQEENHKAKENGEVCEPASFVPLDDSALQQNLPQQDPERREQTTAPQSKQKAAGRGSDPCDDGEVRGLGTDSSSKPRADTPEGPGDKDNQRGVQGISEEHQGLFTLFRSEMAFTTAYDVAIADPDPHFIRIQS